MTRFARLIIARAMAQSVGSRPDTPERERADAVRRIWRYNDELKYMQEHRQ